MDDNLSVSVLSLDPLETRANAYAMWKFFFKSDVKEIEETFLEPTPSLHPFFQLQRVSVSPFYKAIVLQQMGKCHKFRKVL